MSAGRFVGRTDSKTGLPDSPVETSIELARPVCSLAGQEVRPTSKPFRMNAI